MRLRVNTQTHENFGGTGDESEIEDGTQTEGESESGGRE